MHNHKKIVVLEDGAVAEAGSHQQLLAKGGRYAALWARQQAHAGDAPYDGGGGASASGDDDGVGGGGGRGSGSGAATAA